LTYLSFVFDFIIQHIDFDLWIELKSLDQKEYVTLTSLISEGLVYGITLGIKSSFMVFVYIWVRASFPRIRFDQLMTFCWTVLLPLIFAFIICIPCVLHSFDAHPSDISILSLPLIVTRYSWKSLYSTDIDTKVKNQNFKEWFTRFTDGEGCFSIKTTAKNVTSFFY
jgi:hypothetical protein